MVDVEFILKRRGLLGNNGDFPFTWRSFNTELTLTLVDVDFILKNVGYWLLAVTLKDDNYRLVKKLLA